MATDAERAAIAALHRRAGFGLGPGELDSGAADGVAATIDRLVDPDTHGVAAAADPWAAVTLTAPTPLGANASTADKIAVRKQQRDQGEAAIGAWLDHMATTSRPLESWLTWFWHGMLVSGLDKVKSPALMVQQLRTYRDHAFAPFPELLRAATVDPAMLIYLDGRESTGANPNENYGREVMELFALGVGQYTEDDVKAAARALTGWRIDLSALASRFVPKQHDDTPQMLLGASVHDVDSVVAAVTGHAACGPWVAGRMAKAILGPGVDAGLVHDAGTEYAASGFDTRALLRTLLQAAADGHGAGGVWAPVPWLAAARRATGATPPPGAVLQQLRAGGQVPLLPPNVSGWPSGTAWFASSAVVARCDLAAAVAGATAAGNPALVAAGARDAAALADAVGRPEGFSSATAAAIAAAGSDRAALAVALASPDHTLL